MDVSMDWFKVFLEHLQYPKEFPAITSSPNHWLTDGVCERITSRHGHYTHCKNIVFYAPIDEHAPRYPEWILDLCIFGAITGLYFGRLLHREHSKVTRNQPGRHLQSCPWPGIQYEICLLIHEVMFCWIDFRQFSIICRGANLWTWSVLLWFRVVWYQQKLRLANTPRFLSLSPLSPSMSLWKISIFNG